MTAALAEVAGAVEEEEEAAVKIVARVVGRRGNGVSIRKQCRRTSERRWRRCVVLFVVAVLAGRKMAPIVKSLPHRSKPR
jgi:hypothetical protein